MIMTIVPGSVTVAAGHGHVGVDVGHGDRGPGQQAGPGRRLGGEAAGPLADLAQVAAHLRVDDVGEAPGRGRRSRRASGKPSRFDHIAL